MHYLKIILRVVLIGVIFFALIWFADLNQVVSAIKNVSVGYIAILFAIALLVIWISCVKWQVFVRASGHDASITALMKYYTIGYFFNLFFPSYIGGDIARSVHLGNELGNRKDAFMTTFLERFTGLVALCFLGMLFVLFGARATDGTELVVLLGGVVAILLTGMCFNKKLNQLGFSILRYFVGFLGESLGSKVTKILNKIEQSMMFALGKPVLLVKAIFLSLVFHCIAVLNMYVAALAVGWEQPDIWGMFVVLPLILLIGMIPLTPNGLGIQEGAFLFFLERIGGTKAQGLGVGVLLRAKVMVIAILGGVIWLVVRRKTVVPSSQTVTT